MQTCHQIEILTNGTRLITADRAHQIGSKQAKRTGNNHEHIPLRPSFPAYQEGSKILDYLDHFDALTRQTHTPQVSSFDLRSIQNTDDSAYGDDALRIVQNRHHNPQQRIVLENR